MKTFSLRMIKWIAQGHITIKDSNLVQFDFNDMVNTTVSSPTQGLM